MPRDPKERLPLHLACIYGKSTIILYFIEKYPEAACIYNNKTKLPIHYTSANLAIPSKTIQQLVLAFPKSSFEFCQKNKNNNDNDDDNNEDDNMNNFDDNWH